MRADNYHINIKNLSSGKEMGFLLASGDKPYQFQGVDNVAQRVQDGEILYSDFTNSRVFAQSDWTEGVSKYWDPEKNGYYIFPSKKYKDKRNVTISEGEFTLGGDVKEKYTVPFQDGEGPMCRGELAGVVYLGSGMKLYRSEDYGSTWTLFKDFTGVSQLSDVNEITDITITDTESAGPWSYNTMGNISVGNIRCLFVAFYNRTTKVSGIARYDISFSVRGSTGSTYTSIMSSAVGVAYGSNRGYLDINSNGITTTSFTMTKVNNSNGFVLPSSWSSLGLYPGQRLKAVRNYTGIVYYPTVGSIGGPFGDNYEINIWGLPSYSSSPDSLNHYTVSEVGMGTNTICLPITQGGISSVVNVGLGLGQNVVFNGITYNIYGLGNGLYYYGNIPTYNRGQNVVGTDFVRLLRVDGGDAYAGIYGNGNLSLPIEKWIYKFGTYNNRITKFITTEKELTHLWGYNHIDPENKLYDVLLGEMSSNPTYSNLYANSFNGVLHSLQNHTITFNNGHCPISGTGVGYAEGGVAGTDPVMYIGTQLGVIPGTESHLYQFTLNDSVQSAASYTVKAVGNAQGFTSMVYFSSKLYIGSKKRGMVFEYDIGNSTFTELAQLPRVNNESIIDSMTTFTGKIVCSYQKGSGVYVLDPNTRLNNVPLIETDVLCSVNDNNERIYNICNTGGLLLFSNGKKVYSYDQDGITDSGYIESSIYGGYISNVDKQWVYSYVRMSKWEFDDGQRIALQVSLDEGITWQFCPTVKGKQFSTINSWDDTYSIGYNNLKDIRKQQAVFLFPYNTVSGTILYRCWLKKGLTVVPVVNHIGIHYYLKYKQEFLFNYQIDLNKSVELLGGRTIEKDIQHEKLQFIKDIWSNQYEVELTDVSGEKYICVPFSDDRTPGQGLIVSTSNGNSAHLDRDNLTFLVMFSLKTIANYRDTL